MQTADTEDTRKRFFKIKNIFKIIVFIFIFFVLWQWAFSVLWLDKTPISYFYEEPKNSMDVVYVGASTVYVHFNPTLAYNLYGFTTGILSKGSEPFSIMKYLIEETEKNQQPKLYVIDITKIVNEFNTITTNIIRSCTDSMKFSKNRIDAINELLTYTNVDKSQYINYYFSFLLYHNSWKTITVKRFEDTDFYKGYLFSADTVKNLSQDKYNWIEDIEKLSEAEDKVLHTLIDYIKNKEINALFVVPMKPYRQFENKKINDAVNILQENGLDVINFNTLDDFDLDFSTDIWDTGHLNVYGATKYTLYFAKYLKEHFDLPDHRNDVSYSSWSSEYERFKNDYKKITNKNFEDLLLEYK